MTVYPSHRKSPILLIGLISASVLGFLALNDSDLSYNLSAIQTTPEYSGAFIDRGDAYLELGNKRAALEDYSSSIAFHDIYEHAAVERRAMLLFELGDYDGARRDIARAMKLNPACNRGVRKRGTIRLHDGELKGALIDFNKAIEEDPSYGEAYAGRAMLKEQLGRMHGALADYDRAVSSGLHEYRLKRAFLGFQTEGLMGALCRLW